MIRKLSFLFGLLCTVAAFVACGDDDAELIKGSLCGVVTDYATGEPLKSAGVELLPNGLKTVTGSEGQYEFIDLEPGNYKLLVTKTKYADKQSSTIAIERGKAHRYDLQMELLPPALKVVDDNRQEITELVFDNSASDVSRSFNIFNDSPETLEWEITATAEWIKSLSKEKGTLSAGSTQSIILTIDRDKLNGGEDVTTIHVTSDNGSKQITVKVISDVKTLPKLNTLAVSDIHLTTAVFNGEIIEVGSPSYTERGFVYATSSMPTVETTIRKLTVAVNNTSKYSYTATGLEDGKTYYVRAYAINNTGTAYSTNEVSFSPQKSLPVVTTEAATNKSISSGRITLNGNITSAGEPAYTEKGFVYGSSHNPSVEDDTKKAVSGSGTGVFSANLTGLAVGNIYYARAYATSTFGTAYGAEITLDFRAVLPTLRTDEVSDITATSAMLNGTILTVGDPAYNERGFVYGTMPVPSLDESEAIKVTASGTSTGAYTRNVTGLTNGAKYYVRAYAKAANEVVYGEVLSFTAKDPDIIDKGEYVILTAEKLMVQKQDLGFDTWGNAKLRCENSAVGGYSDWRLPSLAELTAIYEKRELIGNFMPYNKNNDGWGKNYTYYWSSDRKSSPSSYGTYYYSYVIDFITGNNTYVFTDATTSFSNPSVGICCFRAVRSITK